LKRVVVILSVLFSLVLLMGMSPLPAYATNFIIDDFSHDPSPVGTGGICDISGSGAFQQNGIDFVTTVSATQLGVLGDWRICDFLIDVPSGATTAGILVSAAPEDAIPFDMFRHVSGTGVETIVMLTYNGTDGTAGTDAVPLSVDLTNSCFPIIVVVIFLG